MNERSVEMKHEMENGMKKKIVQVRLIWEICSRRKDAAPGLQRSVAEHIF